MSGVAGGGVAGGGVASARLAAADIFHIIADMKDDLVRAEALADEVEGELVRHFPNDQEALVGGVGGGENLALTEALGLGLVGLAVRNLRGFPAPGVVDQKLRVDAEEAVEELLVVDGGGGAHRTAGDVAHGGHAVLGELARGSAADAPEVREGFVAPQLLAVGALVEDGDADAVFIRGNMLGHDVHGDLGEVEVGADAGGGGDAGLREDVEDHLAGELRRGHVVEREVVGDVDEDLVDGVHQKVLHGDVAQVDLDDPLRVLHVVLHARRGDDQVELLGRVGRQLRGKCRSAAETPSRREQFTGCVDLADALAHLEKPRAPGNPVRLQGRRNREADCLVRAALVRHDQIDIQRVQTALHGFDRRVK